MVTFSYQARQQAERLTASEKSSLNSLLDVASPLRRTARRVGETKFVGRLSADKRVVWEKGADGSEIVLSIVSTEAVDN